MKNREYLLEVARTGHDPKGKVEVETTKTVTYCILLDQTKNGIKWLKWKTNGRQWREPDEAPNDLQNLLLRFYRSFTQFVAETGAENLRHHGGTGPGAENISDSQYRAEISITTAVSQTMLLKRTRSQAKLLASWLGN